MNYENISDEMKEFLKLNHDSHTERKYERILDAKFPDKAFEINVFIKTHEWIDDDEDAVVRAAGDFLAYYDQKITNEQDIWDLHHKNLPDADSWSNDGSVEVHSETDSLA